MGNSTQALSDHFRKVYQCNTKYHIYSSSVFIGLKWLKQSTINGPRETANKRG